MLCTGEQYQWAQSISENIDSGAAPTSIAIWLRGNLGRLNLALGTSYYLNEEKCIVPDFTQEVSGIYEEMYYCSFINKMARSNLVTLGQYDILSVEGDEQGAVRFVNKNDSAKTYRFESESCEKRLNELLSWYHSNGGSSVQQVIFNDRGHISEANLAPPFDYYTPYNTVWRCG